MCEVDTKTTLIIEPFCSGSHKQLIDLFRDHFGDKCSILTLTGKKWHWRARTSALYFANVVPKNRQFRKLFATSILNLAELIGLRPDLASTSKSLYFHENQLVYPTNHSNGGAYDYQFGYAQILSCLCADHILFNSRFNLESFLTTIDPFMAFIPSDSRVKNLRLTIEPKCKVLHYPMVYPIGFDAYSGQKEDEILQILWPHRWEHDKNPEMFFNILFQLKADGFNFSLVVLGENYLEKPAIFDKAYEMLKDRIKHWGYVEDKAAYYHMLQLSHVAVSTTNHEFFGVSMLEAAYLGCFPLCPNQLCYPEIYPKECLYNTEAQLYKILKNFCTYPKLATEKWSKMRSEFDFTIYSWDFLKDRYLTYL